MAELVAINEPPLLNTRGLTALQDNSKESGDAQDPEQSGYR